MSYIILCLAVQVFCGEILPAHGFTCPLEDGRQGEVWVVEGSQTLKVNVAVRAPLWFTQQGEGDPEVHGPDGNFEFTGPAYVGVITPPADYQISVQCANEVIFASGFESGDLGEWGPK